MRTCGVILAGGKSTRMGQNKALLTIKNKPVIQWIFEALSPVVDEVIIIANNQEEYEFLDVPIYGDRFLNKGPLAGLDSALYHSSSNRIIATACDTPFVKTEVFEYLLNASNHTDITVPMFEDKMHPLSAVYQKGIHHFIHNQLKNDDLKVRKVFDQVNTKYERTFANIQKDVLKEHFFNMNYPEEYELAKKH